MKKGKKVSWLQEGEGEERRTRCIDGWRGGRRVGG